jgi:Transposase, Mutator family
MIEMLRSAEGGELMRRLLGGMLQAVVDAEATAHIGAEMHERSDTRTTQRNGTRDKLLTTAAGDLTVKIRYTSAPPYRLRGRASAAAAPSPERRSRSLRPSRHSHPGHRVPRRELR